MQKILPMCIGSILSAIVSFCSYLLAVHFIGQKDLNDLSCLLDSKRKKVVIPGCILVSALVSVIRVLMQRRPIMIYDDSDIMIQCLIFAAIGIVVGIIGGYVALFVARKEAADVKAAEEKAEEKKEEEYQSSVLRGEWIFPHREFYDLCKENQISAPDGSEFAEIKLQKAVQLILDRHRIPGEIGKLHLSKGGEYYRMAEDEICAAKRHQAQLDSTLTHYTPSEDERQMLDSIHHVRKLRGLEKREYMMRNQIAGLEAERKALYDSLSGSGNQPRFSYTKEKNWATWGGLADGLAGPAAGVMTAMQVRQDNERIREQNKVYMQANLMLDMMEKRHREAVLNKCSELREQQEKLENKLETLPLKVVFTQPDSVTIAESVTLNRASFSKNDSGILNVSASVSCVIPPEMKPIPKVAVDGSIHAKVYTGNRFVEDIYFILPSEGISAGGKPSKVHSLCTTALPVEGEYRLELGNDTTLWMMER